jgi:hypothetical protein
MPKSTTPRNKEISITSAMTTAVEPIVCLRVGQATFFNSTLTSRKNWAALVKILSLGLAADRLVPPDCFFGDAACFLAGTLARSPSDTAFFTPDFWATSPPAVAWFAAACFFLLFCRRWFFSLYPSHYTPKIAKAQS